MSLAALHEELLAYTAISSADQRKQIEKSLWERFGHQGAVMVLDMCRFSITTREHGIVFYLALVAKMQAITAPIVADFDGHIVKFEADNSFAWFADVHHAIGAALAIKEAIAEYNENSSNGCKLTVKFGIDHGRFLVIGDDLWGDPVNCASKLGEDLAMANEILVSQKAIERIKKEEDLHGKVEFNISELVIQAVRV